MFKPRVSLAAFAATVFTAGIVCGAVMRSEAALQAPSKNRVYELRTYYAVDDAKFEALKARFRDHTIALFKQHGLTNIGYYWAPQDGQSVLPKNTLVYVLVHDSREAATKNWAAFQADPDWVKARTESVKNGQLTTKVDSVFLDPVDFSPNK